jgi:zinc protease
MKRLPSNTYNSMSILVVGVLLSFSSQAQIDWKQRIPSDSTVITGKLPNGLTYFIKANPKPHNIAEFRLIVKTGSLQESDEQRGYAHFVEHMAFNGTRNFPKNDLIHYLEGTGMRFGADLNAYTNFKETVYQLQVRSNDTTQLGNGLLILEDWAYGLTFDSLEVEKEKGIILSEWRNRLNYTQRLENAYYPIVYFGARHLQRMPIGDTAIIRKATRKSLQDFYFKWYHAENMALVVVGDFDPWQVEKKIINQFSLLNSYLEQKPQRYDVPLRKERKDVVVTDPEAPFTQAYLYVKNPAKPSQYRLRDLRQNLVESLYNGIVNRRMIDVQQQSKPPFTFAGLGLGSDWGDNEVYSISVFTTSEKLVPALESVWTEAIRARQHGFLPSELKRQKEEILQNLGREANAPLTTNSNLIADRLAQAFLEDRPYPSAQQTYRLSKAILEKINLYELNEFTKTTFRGRQENLVVTGPHKEKNRLIQLDYIRKRLDSLSNTPIAPYTEDFMETPWLRQLPPPQVPIARKVYAEFGITEVDFANGVKVVLRPSGLKEDQVLMQSSSPGGHSQVSDELYPNAIYLSEIMNQSGVAEYNQVNYQKKLSGKSMILSPYLGELDEGFTGSCSRKELEELLTLTYLFYTKPRFDSMALHSFLQRQEGVLRNMLSNPYYAFADQKQKIKFQNNLRRRLPTKEDLEKISTATMSQVYRERYGDANGNVFVLVGDFELEKTIELAGRYLGNLPTQQRKETYRDLGIRMRNGQMDTVLQGGMAPKVYVELTYHGRMATDTRSRYVFNALMSALQISLRENLREEESGVYSLNLTGSPEVLPDSTFRLNLTFNTEPNRWKELIDKALQVFERFKVVGPDLPLLEKIKSTQWQNRLKAEQENSFWLIQLLTRYKENRGLDGLRQDRYKELIDSLKTQDLMDAAKRYLSGENRMILVLKPEGGG